jgi:YHS domain-containing protein
VVADLPPWATVEAADEVSVRGLEHPIAIVRLGLPQPGPDTQPDPVCQIALTHATAGARRHDGDGRELLFCAESCAEMWEQRRRGSSEIEAGSIREVWMR